MIIKSVAHLDHSLLPIHMSFIRSLFGNRQSFFIETVSMPLSFEFPGTQLTPALPEVQLALYGPAVGDAPVLDEECTYAVRGARSCASRMVNRPMRLTRLLTVIAGPHEGERCVLYTAYGGPLAPREPGDLSLGSWEEIQESRKFWQTHALAKESA